MKAHGLPKSERIRKKPEFSRTLSEGSRLDAESILAYWTIPSEEIEARANRVGFAAGRRLGGAVQRNRLKRRLREAYRKNKDELPWKNLSIIFLARQRALQCDANEIERDVIALLRRIALATESESAPSRSSSPPTEP